MVLQTSIYFNDTCKAWDDRSLMGCIISFYSSSTNEMDSAPFSSNIKRCGKNFDLCGRERERVHCTVLA